ncbi:MAG: SDR family NAD(P)-dependent oxidoreductase [Planctomycetes bacterium]|nr:SDR family NAD(P)-dependent oxidoreductase [Planctomycetota bacterium]
MKLLDGKVAIVTGAGGGLGRCHALALVAAGAKVVVNDVGGSRDGTGGGSSMAEAVVGEIQKAGGTAVANTDSVSDPAGAERIVQSALQAFGRLDILVNNAGILRDKSLPKMEDGEWRPVIAVHLDGSFFCGRSAARCMKDNNVAGRIINTTSYAGLVGNFGQSNYGAAKAGIAGLTRVWAQELSKYGITVNALAPMAKTRMTEDIDAIPGEMTPEMVSPLVVFLASDLAKGVNGKILGAHGRHYFEYKTVLTPGVKKESDWTVQEIAEKFGAICGEGAPPPAALKMPESLTERIKLAFQLMEKAFTPEKAKGWKAVLHFFIEGADNYTIGVDEGKAAIRPGHEGSATCQVRVAAATLADMIEGKLSGVQAFMSGKIKANNLNDLKRFGEVFDFKRARAAATQGAAPAPATVPVAGPDLAPVMERLPQAFLPDRAAGWNGKVVFDAAGTPGWTLTIQDKQCSVAPGKAADATCTISGPAEVLGDVLTGKVDFMQAAGKLKANNVPAVLKLKQAIDWAKLKSSAWAAPAPAASTGLNRALVGKKYKSGALFVRPEKIRAYLAATLNEAAAPDVAPPLFPVTLIPDLFRAIVADDHRGDLSRVVHGEQRMRFGAPLRSWDLVTPRGTIAAIDAKETGEIMHVDQDLYCEGKLAVEMRTSLFFRGTQPKSASSSPAAPEKPAGKKLFSTSVTVPEDLSRRYAAVSGDDNPIHIDPEAAKAVGLPGVILHGLCTMALATSAIVEHLGGDASRIEELAVRFSSVVQPGDTLTTEGYEVEPKRIAFVTTNQSGKAVLTNGAARIR